MEGLFSTAGDTNDEVARHLGVWSVVVAQFAKGDTRELAIPAKVGERYAVQGDAESFDTDVDICVYAPGGAQIECDTLEDSYPIVAFIARADGVYRAVMMAASVGRGDVVRRDDRVEAS